MNIASAKTLREAVAKQPSRQVQVDEDGFVTDFNGHLICLFVDCGHWFDVCIGIVKSMGFDEYVKEWSKCRCGWEKNPPMVWIDDEVCPACQVPRKARKKTT